MALRPAGLGICIAGPATQLLEASSSSQSNAEAVPQSVTLTTTACVALRVRIDAALTEHNAGELLCVVQELFAANVSLTSLKDSQLARLIKKKLTRHADGAVSHAARILVSRWKALLDADVLHEAASVAMAATEAAPISGGGIPQLLPPSWMDDDDVVASVLAQCGAAALSQLRVTSRAWLAKAQHPIPPDPILMRIPSGVRSDAFPAVPAKPSPPHPVLAPPHRPSGSPPPPKRCVHTAAALRGCCVMRHAWT